MWRPFADITKIYFKGAKIAIDKFHFTRYVILGSRECKKESTKGIAG